MKHHIAGRYLQPAQDGASTVTITRASYTELWSTTLYIPGAMYLYSTRKLFITKRDMHSSSRAKPVSSVHYRFF